METDEIPMHVQSGVLISSPFTLLLYQKMFRKQRHVAYYSKLTLSLDMNNDAHPTVSGG